MALSIGELMPPLEGATGYANDTGLSDDAPRKPTLVQFWAVSCPICKSNMPRLIRLLETYKDEGLQLISIHMPRGEGDLDVGRVEKVMQEIGLTGPCAIDNKHTLGDRFQTGGVWPSYFLFDAEGKLRSRAAGVLGLKMAENSLKRLLELENKP